MTGFETRSSGIGSDRTINFATTTDQQEKCLRSFKDDRGQWLWISRYLERLWYRRAAVRIQSLSVFIYYQLYGKDKIEASNSQKISILYYLGYISLAQSFHFHGKFYKFQLSSCCTISKGLGDKFRLDAVHFNCTVDLLLLNSSKWAFICYQTIFNK